MAALHQALECLAPTNWDSVPVSPPDKLRAYVSDIFKKSQLIAESVPEPPPSLSSSSSSSSSGGNGGSSRRSRATATAAAAKTASPPPSLLSSRISNSPARTGTTDPQLASLQKEWGKPIKVGNGKENPLDIPVYKLAGKDGRGAWFARRSVHEGLPFSRWKAKLQSEIGETLRMREERRSRGLPPDASIRGIGGDRKAESVEVRDPDDDRTLLGLLEVYLLSAQFPGPTAARDFVTLLITTDRVFDDEERDDEITERAPRSYMIVSKPCDHPETPPREGYIRGQYESVELIREVRVGRSKKERESASSARQYSASSPLLDRKSVGQRWNSFPIRLRNKSADDLTRHVPSVRERSKTDSAEHEHEAQSMATGEREGDENEEIGRGKCEHFDDEEEEDMNPVEWIMITRSDPGGSVPRWMVERGTPKSIVTDAAKFVNWACQTDGLEDGLSSDKGYATIESHKPSPRSKSITRRQAYGHPRGVGGHTDEKSYQARDQPAKTASRAEEYRSEQPGSLISSVANMVNTGLEKYAPRAVLDYIPGYFSRPPSPSQGDREPVRADEDKISVTSSDTFTSAGSHHARSVAGDSTSVNSLNRVPSHTVSSSSGGITTPLHDNGLSELSEDITQIGKKLNLTSQEKTLAKLASRKREIERRLAQIRAEEESLGLLSKARNAADSERVITTSSMDNAEDVRVAAGNKGTINKPRPETLKAHKSASNLFRNESKLLKQLTKIEEQQLKVASKIEARRRREAERNEKLRSRLEVESLRREVQGLKKEVEELRGEREHWLDLIGRLQSENTRLAAQRNGMHKD